MRMKQGTILYTCPFVPSEWISAHGLTPARLTPRLGTTARLELTGLCPYAKAFVLEVCSSAAASGIVFTTTCDQMRRASELTRMRTATPIHVMHVPTSWQSPTAHKMYEYEINRLSDFLVSLGGERPSREHLAQTMNDSERSRRHAHHNHSHKAGQSAKAIPLAVIGESLLTDRLELLEAIEQAGGCIALDATASGERTQPAAFDRHRLAQEPLAVLQEAYFATIPDAFRRPNTQLYQWLKQHIVAQDIRGIVLHYYQWCDIWRAETQRMKQWGLVPVLVLESGETESDKERIMTRVQAFLEMLK